MSSDFLHPDRERGTTKQKKIKAIPNKLAAFKLNPRVDPKVRQKYDTRKVNLIDKKKFQNKVNQKPEDQFFGSLKIF